MVLEISGYETVSQNSVYTKEGKAKAGNPVRDVLLLQRHTLPIQQEVIDYICIKAQSSGSSGLVSLSGNPLKSQKSRLEQALSSFPQQVIADFNSRNEDLMRYLQNNTSLPILKEGELPWSYFDVSYGVLPTGLIADNEKEGKIKSSEWYHGALFHPKLREAGFGMQSNLKIKLQEDGTLTPKDKIDFHIQEGTDNSRTFIVNRPYYPADRIQKIVDSIYAKLPTAEDIQRVEDVSEAVLEVEAMRPLMALHQRVQLMAAISQKQHREQEEIQRLLN